MGFDIVPGGSRKEQKVILQEGEPVGYQQLTVADSAVGLTVPISANSAIMVLETGAIRWRDDGTDPTDAIGMLLNATNTLQVESNIALTQFKAIRDTATSGVLNISYYKK